MFSLQDSQKGSLTRMLQLSETPTQTWKVLIYDKVGQEVLAPILKVGALRHLGVTLHLSLHSDRQPVPGVPVVYFVEPSEQNMTRLSSDLNQGLYEASYINFVSSISRERLQWFAARLSPSVRVSQIVDRFCSFVAHSPSSYSLALPGVYSALHASGASEAAIEATVDKIVEGLFSLAIACRQVPVIRATSGEAAEMVARRLSSKLREFIISGGSTATELLLTPKAESLGGSAGRPLFLLLDRDIDLSTALSHTWHYQALLQDVLGMRDNRVRLQGKDIDLDSSDAFFKEHAHSPFPAVATALNDTLADFNKRRQNVTAEEAKLTAAFDLLPQLSEKKRSLDMHTTLATALLSAISDRKLDRWFEWESSIGYKSVGSLLTEFLEIGGSDPLDQARALYVLLLRKGKEINAQQTDTINKSLAGLDGRFLDGAKYVRYLASIKSMADAKSNAGSQGGVSAYAPGAIRGLLSGIKQILPSRDELKVTRTLENCMENASEDGSGLVYLDPRGESGARYRGVFRAGAVCMIGGGCVTEMGNVIEWAGKVGRNVLYGGTDMPSPAELAKELIELGGRL